MLQILLRYNDAKPKSSALVCRQRLILQADYNMFTLSLSKYEIELQFHIHKMILSRLVQFNDIHFVRMKCTFCKQKFAGGTTSDLNETVFSKLKLCCL